MKRPSARPRPVRVLIVAGMLSAACSAATYREGSVDRFQEIPVDRVHVWDETVHPFSGAAVIDVDGDGTVELFVGGGNGQPDALLSYRDGRFVDIVQATGLSSPVATYGSVSLDIDDDGDVDLLVARENGVHLHLNHDGTFTSRKIPVDLPDEAVVLGIALSDVDRDGDADLYLSVFVDFAHFRSAVYNDPVHAKGNRLLLNNGDLTFTDITAQSGTAGKQNTFLSVFTDLDNDGWQDLVVSQNTGEIEIFRNNRDMTFTAVPVSSGFGFWMGVAVGDIDNDGDQDIFFSNVGDSIPGFLTSGDLRDDQPQNLEWLLLRNEGGFRFTDVTAAYGISGEGFAWGAVFEDLNLDGRLDLLVAQNYIKWPVHKLFKLPGRTYLQTARGTFEHVEALGLENAYFGQSPVIADFDNDGLPDVAWLNMNGPVRAFLNRSKGRSFKVVVPDSARWLGTRVHVVTRAGRSYTREVVTSTGMLTDQASDLIFGLGDSERVDEVVVEHPDGRSWAVDSPGRSYVLSEL